MKKLRQLYEEWTPLGQILAFVVVMGTIVFKGGMIWSRVDNYDPRISAVETLSTANSQHYTAIDQKLDGTNKRLDNIDRNMAQLYDYLLNKKVAENDRGRP